MKKINVITIDGPSASGKGALSRRVAKHFNLNILDSGVLYRLFAYFFNLNINHQEISDIIKHKIDFKFIIFKMSLKVSSDRSKVKCKIHPCYEHKNNDNILN